MRLRVNTNKDGSRNLYVMQSYRNSRGVSTTKIVEKLGSYTELEKLHPDPIAWAKQYIAQLNAQNDEEQRAVSVDFDPTAQLNLNDKRLYGGGYLYLQKYTMTCAWTIFAARFRRSINSTTVSTTYFGQ